MPAPERTCIGCRRRGRQSEFLRVKRANDGRLELDATGRSGGRGAYVCRSVSCVDRALTHKTLRHVFRLADTVSDEQLEGLTRALRGQIGSAHE